MSAHGRWALLLLPFYFASNALAQEAPIPTVAFEDPEVFCHILHHNKKQRLTALGSVKEVVQNPADTVLIVFGDPRAKHAEDALSLVRRFQEQGGAVLIATDMQTPRDRRLPIYVTGKKIERAESYEEITRCPWLALPRAGGAGGEWDRQHPIFQFVLKGIATNCPSSLRIVDRAAPLHVLLSFPPDGRAPNMEHYIIGSPADSAPHGRSLYIAGHGVFMNGMLLQSKADNFRFAMNVVDWLAEAPDGKQRTRALLIVDGTIVPDFDTKLTPPPPPIPMPPRAIINRLLRDLQEEGRIRQGFYDSLDTPSALAYALSFLVVGLLIYGAKKVLQGRHQIDAEAPRMVGKTPQIALAPSTVQAQQIATLKHANFRREARQLAQAWLQQEFGVEPEHWDASTNVQLRVERHFWSSGATQAQAALVVSIARIAKGAAVSQCEFLRIHRALHDLTKAACDGRVALLINGKNVRKSM